MVIRQLCSKDFLELYTFQHNINSLAEMCTSTVHYNSDLLAPP